MTLPILADTGPLYAAVDPDDSYHQRSQRELRRLSRERRSVLVAYPILMEAYTLVLHKLGSRVASAWLNDTLTGADLINPTVDDYLEATKKVIAYHDQLITLFDAVNAVLASRLGIGVWTYDHHFDVMRTAVWR